MFQPTHLGTRGEPAVERLDQPLYAGDVPAHQRSVQGQAAAGAARGGACAGQQEGSQAVAVAGEGGEVEGRAASLRRAGAARAKKSTQSSEREAGGCCVWDWVRPAGGGARRQRHLGPTGGVRARPETQQRPQAVEGARRRCVVDRCETILCGAGRKQDGSGRERESPVGSRQHKKADKAVRASSHASMLAPCSSSSAAHWADPPRTAKCSGVCFLMSLAPCAAPARSSRSTMAG